MMAVNRQGNCQWKQSGATKKCPEQDLPILEPLLAKDPQAYAGAKQGQEVLEVQRVVNPCRLIFSKRDLDALIVELGRIDVLHDSPISLT